MDAKQRAIKAQNALADFFAQHGPALGLRLAGNRAAYGEAEVRITLTLRATDEGAQAAEFKAVCGMYGVKPEAYLADIPRVGKLVGFAARRSKFCVRVLPLGETREKLYTADVLRRLPADLTAEWMREEPRF